YIKMSINDKMWVIFLLFLVALTSVAGSRYFNEIQQFEQQAISASEAKLSGIVDAQSNRATEIDGVSKSNRVSESSFVDGSVTAYAKLHSGEVIKLTQNVSTQYESVKSSALSSLLLSFLWVIPFALFSYWVATFIGGA
ncbi:methyl-accepting chemotaxis protein, partial [Vibrio parahaemolyticus]|nr:methyl-accepting chemotaxis protein [Vibrio parahaemolyticus]